MFIAAPTSIVTGLMQSPAISNRLGWFGRALNRQRARSIHFIALCWFLFFILAHVTLVFITGARVNLNMMFAGVNDDSWSGFAVFVPAMLLVARRLVAGIPGHDALRTRGSERSERSWPGHSVA